MDVVRHGGAPGCVSNVDWAPEPMDYGVTVRAQVWTEREREMGLAVGLIVERAW